MMIPRIDVLRRAAMLATSLVLAAAATAGAQSTADPRWAAWLGCWQPTPTSAAELPASLPFVCVSPTSVASAVEIATIANDAVVTHDTIDASGRQRPVDRQGCTGWQRAEWSGDVRRVFLRSELTCAGGVTRTSTGILAMSPTGEWLDVQGINAGASSGVRAMRYHGSGAASLKLPAGVIDVSAGRDLAVQTARTAAGSTLNVSDVVEAVKRVDTAVVQTWIAQRGVHFVLNASQLIAMADAGVPGSVTDVMIGISYPEHFALQEQSAGPMIGSGLSLRDSALIASEYLSNRCIGGPDPLWYSLDSYDPCAYRYGSRGLAYGFGSRYGFPGYNSYYNNYYNNYYGGGYNSGYYVGYYGAPVIVVKGEETAHGKLVNGRGYTRGSGSSSSSSGSSAGASSTRSSGSSGSSASGSSSSGSSSSGSSSGGSSSSGSSSSGRTAVARPPQ